MNFIGLGLSVLAVSALGQSVEDCQQYTENSQRVYNRDPARRPDFSPPDKGSAAGVARLREIVTRTILSASSQPGATADSIRQAINHGLTG